MAVKGNKSILHTRLQKNKIIQNYKLQNTFVYNNNTESYFLPNKFFWRKTHKSIYVNTILFDGFISKRVFWEEAQNKHKIREWK